MLVRILTAYAIHAARHVMHRAHALRMELEKYSAGGRFNKLVRILLSWLHGDPCFSFHRSLPSLILSILTKSKQNLNVRSFDYLAFSTNAGVITYKYPSVRLILPEGMTSAALNKPICVESYLEFSILL